MLFTSVVSQIINSWPNRKLLNYTYLQQLRDIMPGILLAAFMAVCVWCVGLLGLNSLVTMLIQIVLGAAIYLAGSVLFKLESFRYLLSVFNRKIIKK